MRACVRARLRVWHTGGDINPNDSLRVASTRILQRPHTAACRCVGPSAVLGSKHQSSSSNSIASNAQTFLPRGVRGGQTRRPATAREKQAEADNDVYPTARRGEEAKADGVYPQQERDILLAVPRARAFHNDEKRLRDVSRAADNVECSCSDRVDFAASTEGENLDASNEGLHLTERAIASDFASGLEEQGGRRNLGWAAESHGNHGQYRNDNDRAGWAVEPHRHGRFRSSGNDLAGWTAELDVHHGRLRRNKTDPAGSVDSRGHARLRNDDNGIDSYCAVGPSGSPPRVCKESEGVLGQRGRMLPPQQPLESGEGPAPANASRASQEVLALPADLAAFK